MITVKRKDKHHNKLLRIKQDYTGDLVYYRQMVQRTEELLERVNNQLRKYEGKAETHHEKNT